MKKVILTMAVLLMCVSIGFSQMEKIQNMRNCQAKAYLESLQEIYASLKKEKPEYEPVIDKLVVRANDNQDYYRDFEEIRGLHNLFVSIGRGSNIVEYVEHQKKLEKKLKICEYE